MNADLTIRDIEETIARLRGTDAIPRAKLYVAPDVMVALRERAGMQKETPHIVARYFAGGIGIPIVETEYLRPGTWRMLPDEPLELTVGRALDAPHPAWIWKP